MMKVRFAWLLLFFFGEVCAAQTKVVRISIPPKAEQARDDEDWHVQVTGEYWALWPSGSATTDSFTADFKNDLGIEGWKSHPSIRAAFQPTRKNKIIVEGIKYRLNGGKLIQRELVFRGHTFAVNDQTESTIKVASVYAGYQRDLISRSRGFLGIEAGMNYFEANAQIQDLTLSAERRADTRLAFPVVGASFRMYPPANRFFNINGEAKGMALGNYGKSLGGEINLGFPLSQMFTVQAGFRALGTDLHNKYETSGVRTTFRGPVISIQWRDR